MFIFWGQRGGIKPQTPPAALPKGTEPRFGPTLSSPAGSAGPAAAEQASPAAGRAPHGQLTGQSPAGVTPRSAPAPLPPTSSAPSRRMSLVKLEIWPVSEDRLPPTCPRDWPSPEPSPPNHDAIAAARRARGLAQPRAGRRRR